MNYFEAFSSVDGTQRSENAEHSKDLDDRNGSGATRIFFYFMLALLQMSERGGKSVFTWIQTRLKRRIRPANQAGWMRIGRKLPCGVPIHRRWLSVRFRWWIQSWRSSQSDSISAQKKGWRKSIIVKSIGNLVMRTLLRSVSALSGSSAANIADEMRIQARIMLPK